MASPSPSIPDILARKRDGQELTQEEIQAFVNAVVNDGAQKEQIGAWLMAVFIRGLSERETVDLTAAMMRSGECLSWPAAWDGLVVDKHSTGGVGDKVSLVLAPALAACGMKVPMISGRGLEHTGGTLDKLEAIPQFNVSMTAERMQEVMNTVGCCIVGQTDDLVPADKILYATRDVTGTVAQDGLITGRCRKRAGHQNSRRPVLYGESWSTVGHAVEVSEAVNCLKGQGPDDLQHLVAELGKDIFPRGADPSLFVVS
ncbi:hypothetical protein C0Q70_11029 [Pomacea canaliculata]|uniref:Thymidine phosphorylase n=1 Tax=Pomacea canaliculata TaxID=400727 RepID=A0A2T7P4V4_POMCA|nr:hypothetical protein C0Q70_11029 [Pomacea canaliculata]